MTRLTDEQRLAVESIDKNVIVSAGAGSGKTSVLVSRYLQVLEANPQATVSNLIAVTFTRKAADEMRSRLKSELKSRAAAAFGAEQARWLELLARIDQARIGTIHSLCESILRAFPSEAMMDPQFEVLDDLERAELLSEAIDEQVRAALARTEEHMLKLLQFSAVTVGTWLKQLVNSPSVYKAARAAHSNEHLFEVLWTRAAAAAFNSFLKDRKLNTAIHDLKCLTVSGKFEERRLQALVLCEPLFATISAEAGPQDYKTRLALADSFSELNFKGARNAGEGERAVMAAVNCIKDALTKLRESIPSQQNDADLSAQLCQQALIELSDRALSRFDELKNIHQKVDFDDLIDRTHTLLSSEHSYARRHYNATTISILVDEFQDTNKRQAELISCLRGPDARLFLIGDDKQSIYRFQGADVSTFNEWKDRLRADEQSGLLLRLTRSFRSHPSIVAFVNAMFQRQFAQCTAGDRFEATHQSLLASREEAVKHEHVEVVMLESNEGQDDLSSFETEELEGRAIAAWILDKVAGEAKLFDKETRTHRPICFADFAVLVQSNNDFAPIELALADAGIPYVTMSGSGYLNRQEVYDMQNLLRFLVCPEDSHALFGVLRSPLFGVPDDVVQSIHGNARTLWSSTRRAAAQPECPFPGIQRAVTILRDLQKRSFEMSLADLVRYILQTTQFDLALSAMPNGRQRSRNLWKFVSLATQHSAVTVRAFIDLLDSMRDLGVKAGDAPLSADNAVQLMTIHKSKGLEFGAVALPGLAKQIHKYDRQIIHNEEYGICLNARELDEKERPALFTLASTIERQMEAAEKKRLLYVAMTRARDYLGLFVARTVKKEAASFRYWIKDTLKLDEDTSDGQFSLDGADGPALYSVRAVSPARLSSWIGALKTTNFLAAQANAAVEPIDFSLVSPLQQTSADRSETTVAFEHLLRVTPTAQPLHATSVGTFFHTVMESLPADLSLPGREQLRDLAFNSDLATVDVRIDELLVEAEQMLRRFQGSQLHTLLAGARVRLHEPPYLAVRTKQETDFLIAGPAAQNFVQERRPDLVVQDTQGQWHIIDFKTDHIDEMEIEKHNRQHAEQISEYVADLESLVKTPVRGWVYYAHHGQLAQIAVVVTASAVEMLSNAQPRL